MLAHLISALLALAPPVTAETGYEAPMLPPVTVIERRGFDPETGAGSSIDVENRRNGLASTAELLGREAGVTIRSAGNLLQAVSIRGSASTQVHSYLNGIPLPSSLAGAFNTSLLPPEALSRIDVYRGSPPARYARAPLGGAVDFITHEKDISSLRAGAGSHGIREAAAYVSLAPTDTRITAGAGIRRSLGDFEFFNNNGTPGNADDDRISLRRNNDYKGANGFVTFSHDFPIGELRGHAIGTGINHGMAGFVQAPAEKARLDQRLYAGGAGFVLPLPNATLETSVFGGQLRERFQDPRGELTVPGNNLLNVADQAGTRAVLEYDAGWFQPQASFEAESLWFHSEKSDTSQPVYEQVRSALAVSPGAQLGNATTRLTLLGEYQQTHAEDLIAAGQSLGANTVSRLLPAATLGAAYKIGYVTLLANSGIGFRFPSAQEQFGDRGVQVGNPDLKPERGRFADAGISYQHATRRSQWQTEVRVFRQDIRDLIAIYQTSPRTASALNFDAVRSVGIEWQGTLAISLLRLRANAVYQDIRNQSKLASYDGKLLPGRPVFESDLEVAIETQYLIPFYAVHAQDEFYLDPVNSDARRISGRVYHDAGLTVRPHSSLKVSGTVDNINDVRSYDYIGFPLPGRSFNLVVHYQPSQTLQIK